MSTWLGAFILTQVVEVPIYTYGWLARDGAPRSVWFVVVVAFAASCLTHPVLWLVFPHVAGVYWVKVAVAEALIVVAEAGFLTLAGLRRAFWWALLANAVSAGVAFAWRALGG